jgi:hypothetical protein
MRRLVAATLVLGLVACLSATAPAPAVAPNGARSAVRIEVAKPNFFRGTVQSPRKECESKRILKLLRWLSDERDVVEVVAFIHANRKGEWRKGLVRPRSGDFYLKAQVVRRDGRVICAGARSREVHVAG